MMFGSHVFAADLQAVPSEEEQAAWVASNPGEVPPWASQQDRSVKVASSPESWGPARLGWQKPDGCIAAFATGFPAPTSPFSEEEALARNNWQVQPPSLPPPVITAGP